MAHDKVTIEWKNIFEGTLYAPNGKLSLGASKGALKPYNLLFGALGACFYSTFVNVAQKKKLDFAGASMEIEGVTRQELPQTLETVVMRFMIKKASDRDQFMQCVDYGIKYCSIHKTIGMVAAIKITVEFTE